MRKEQFKQYVNEIIKEIEKHKWFESEKAGHNIGGNEAALDWLAKHYEGWRKAQSDKFPDRDDRSNPKQTH